MSFDLVRVRRCASLIAVGVALVLGATIGAMRSQGEAYATMAQAESLYGAACPKWDSSSESGCLAGCERSGELLWADGGWIGGYDRECSVETEQCAPSGGGSGAGTCGTYQYIVQCN